MTFEIAKKVADAVLYEGYVLYPYRASAAKNQIRWQFGVIAPRAWGEATQEPFEQQTQCLLEADDTTMLDVRLRFLQVQAKLVEELSEDGHSEDGAFAPVQSLTVDGATHITWDEAVEQQIDLDVPLAELLEAEKVVTISIPGDEQSEELRDAAGSLVGRVQRIRQRLVGTLRLSAERLDGPFGGIRLTALTENLTPWNDPSAPRNTGMRYAFVACHTLLGLTPHGSGQFISLLEPPQWAKPHAQACVNTNTFPVLIGDKERPDVVLSSPIILYDWPEIAPESQGDLFDATEIDEILILRTMTLTDEEKQEARDTDPRSAAIIDRVDSMPPDLLDRLHGAVRYLQGVTGSPARRPEEVPEFGTNSDGVPVFGEQRPFGEEFADRRPAAAATPWWDPGSDSSVSPDTDAVDIGGVAVAKGDKVIIRPGARRSDAQDMFLAGMVADVQAVFHDLENKQFLAVTLQDDPNADLQIENGRFLYFSPDEVEPYEPSTTEQGSVSA